MPILRALQTERAEVDAPDGYVFEELAECLLAMGSADKATPFFMLAHGALMGDAWLVKHEAERLKRLAHTDSNTGISISVSTS